MTEFVETILMREIETSNLKTNLQLTIKVITFKFRFLKREISCLRNIILISSSVFFICNLISKQHQLLLILTTNFLHHFKKLVKLFFRLLYRTENSYNKSILLVKTALII